MTGLPRVPVLVERIGTSIVTKKAVWKVNIQSAKGDVRTSFDFKCIVCTDTIQYRKELLDKILCRIHIVPYPILYLSVTSDKFLYAPE